jgi:group I intron endonuclease
MYGIIYIITNRVNGKRYVGKTVQREERRWSQHLTKARRNPKYYLHMAMRKHGLDNFSFEVVDRADSEAELTAKDVEYIARLGTTSSSKGYNCTVGGDGGAHGPSAKTRVKGKIVSPEHRAKLSAAGKGRKLSPEHVAKLRARVVTEETRKKMSLSRPTFSPEQIAMYRERGRNQERPPVTSESRGKMSHASKSWWDAHPEAKERMRTRVVSAETREKCREAAKKGWETRSYSPFGKLVLAVKVIRGKRAKSEMKIKPVRFLTAVNCG